MAIDRKNIPYRQSTSALITNKIGQILIIQKNSWQDNEWDFPGGGVDSGENPTQAILRELNEELGSNKFEIVKISKIIDKYDWPDEVIIKRRLEKNQNFRGQERTQFLVKFEGEGSEIKTQVEEIKKHQWISISDLEKYFIFPNQFESVKKVLEEFGLMYN